MTDTIVSQCESCAYNIGECRPGKCEISCGNAESPMYGGDINLNGSCPVYFNQNKKQHDLHK
jgi:hypothetical protein